MVIIHPKGNVDTLKETVVFMFENDDEMNDLLTKIATTSVKTSGNRIVIISKPPDSVMTDTQAVLIDVIESMDGIGSKDKNVNVQIVERIRELINKLLDK